ncbi:hypothetical protein IWQ61_005026 [Dispira simplex]|nr:hypothetical protein IWQ61_005026 [Dispira simplex]
MASSSPFFFDRYYRESVPAPQPEAPKPAEVTSPPVFPHTFIPFKPEEPTPPAKYVPPTITVAQTDKHITYTLKWEKDHCPYNFGWGIKDSQFVVCAETKHGIFEHALNTPKGVELEKRNVDVQEGVVTVRFQRTSFNWVTWVF